MPDNMTDAQIPLAINTSGADIAGPIKQVEGVLPFAAKMQAGKIIANSSDPQSAIDQLQKNPTIAAWAPELISQYTTMHNIAVNTTSVEAGQRRDALSGFFAQFLPKIRDPNFSMDEAEKAYKKGLPPSVLKTTEPALDSYREIFDSLPPEQRSSFMVGMATATGMDPSHLSMMLPAAGSADLKSGVQPTLTNPSFGPNAGEVHGAGPVVPYGVPPQVNPTGPAGAQPIQGITSPGFAQGGQEGVQDVPLATSALGTKAFRPAQLSRLTPDAQAELDGANSNVTAGAQSAQSAPFQAQSPEMASDGKPLYIPATDAGRRMTGLSPTNQGLTIPGTNTPFNANDAKINDNNAATYDADRAAYPNSEYALGQLQSLSNLSDIMNDPKNPGYNTGALKPLMGQFQKAVNGLYQTLWPNDKPPYSIDQLGATDYFQKTRAAIQAQLSNTLIKGQESNHLFDSIGSTLPGIENTPLGLMLTIDGAKALLERQIDRTKFFAAYERVNGNFYNAQEEFSKQHPFNDVENSVLQKYGLTKDGFASRQQIVDFAQKGFFGAGSDGRALFEQAYRDYVSKEKNRAK